jgi:hypothetical protein
MRKDEFIRKVVEEVNDTNITFAFKLLNRSRKLEVNFNYKNKEGYTIITYKHISYDTNFDKEFNIIKKMIKKI